MPFVPINSTQTDAESPIDVQLFDIGVRQNLNDHEARILALEGGGGGGGGGGSAAASDGRYGSIVAGFNTNEPILWRRRYHPYENTLNSGEKLVDPTGFDPTNEDKSRWINTSASKVLTTTSENRYFKGFSWILNQNDFIEFVIKKGENFFGISYEAYPTSPYDIQVLIDGQSITSFGGIVDENGTARTDNFSGNVATNTYQFTQWFFGLDGKEHTVQVTCLSAAISFTVDSIEVGYASKDGSYCVDNVVHVDAGRVSVRGTEVATTETNLTIGSSTGGGHTAAIVADTSGALTVVNGVEPAFTMAKPQEAIAFSSPVTSLIAQSTKRFPANGFLLVTRPDGKHSIASYASKTETDVANMTFNTMQWQSQPTKDFTPANAFETATLGIATGDIGINLWAGGGHVISASNNKLDFKITVNGTETTHSATISSGCYSADLVPLGLAIKKAMQTVKPLSNGEYVVTYNSESYRWSISAIGGNVTSLKLDFATGANVASSIHTTIGFNSTDLTGATSYVAQNEVQSLAHKVFRKGEFVSAFDSRLKTALADTGTTTANQRDLAGRVGLPAVKKMVGNVNMVEFYTDEDAAGLAIHYMPEESCSTLFVSIDDTDGYRALKLDSFNSTSSRSKVATAFVSFARGSRKISFWFPDTVEWQNNGVATLITNFVGVTQYHTKPKIEALTSEQAVIKSLDVAPVQLFQTWHAHNQTPGSSDALDTITFTGSWSTVSSSTYWNQSTRRTTTSGDFVDVTFTLAGNGGGFGWAGANGVRSRKVGMFLKAGSSLTETGNRIHNTYIKHSSFDYQQYLGGQILGLPAGQYTVRIKQEETSGQLDITAFIIYDTVQPDTAETVGAVTTTGQSVSWPLYAVIRNVFTDNQDRTQTFLSRSGYKEGISYFDAASFTLTVSNLEENSTLPNAERAWYSFRDFALTTDYLRMFQFCKAIFSLDKSGSSAATSVQTSINNVNFSTYSQATNAKGGAAYGSPNQYNTHFQKNMLQFASGTMSDSTTFLLSNTRGIRAGMTVKVYATGETTLYRVVASVTANTNIVFTQAITNFANYTTANLARVTFAGFQAWKFVPVTGTAQYCGVAYEPMDVLPSKDDERRLAASKVGEVAEIIFFNVADNGDAYYPYFSDGRQASWSESAISIIKTTSTATTWDIPHDLRNIRVSAGTLDIKIVAVRKY